VKPLKLTRKEKEAVIGALNNAIDLFLEQGKFPGMGNKLASTKIKVAKSLQKTPKKTIK